ncbi:MAG: HD-GYP domain-containing protein [Treponema sp.]|nr:HD-GYP domain-containing protein [Treponema sp.]
MITYKTSETKENTYFSETITLDSMFIIAVPPCPVSGAILKLLDKWGIKEFYSAGDIRAKAAQQAAQAPKPTPQKKAEISTATESVDLSEFGLEGDSDSSSAKKEIPQEFMTSEEVDLSEFDESAPKKPDPVPKSVATPAAPHSTMGNLDGTTKHKTTSLSAYLEKHEENKRQETLNPALANRMSVENLSEEQDKILMNEAQKTYEKFMQYIFDLYTKYATTKMISQPELNGKILELCNFVRENKKFILRITPSYEARNKNFLISHSLRTAVIAIVIGLQLKMPYEDLIELGVACVLHEIGQIKLPPQLYMNNKPLNAAEKAQMANHTVLGYNIVKEAGFSKNIQFGVLDHHERETGTGYPRHIPGNKISFFAKITGVACSYEAITAPRHFKEARSTYEAMIEMLRNSTHEYDDTVVKALLYSVSLFPIGSFVYLSNGKVAQVIDVSPDNPKNPVVKVIGSLTKDGKPTVIQTNDVIRIMRVMTQQESEDLKKMFPNT